MHQKKGAVVYRFDVLSHISFEVLESEKHVTSTSDRIVRLAFRGGR